jgi:hypothetical protein
LKSLTQVSLESAGGGPGRNWSGLAMIHGLRWVHAQNTGSVVGT